MPIQSMNVKITGIGPLLTNNPQMVDRFNPFARAAAAINAKKTKRTDDDYMELQDIEVRAKAYWDDDIGLYVPSTWLISSICKHSFAQAKTSKDAIRGAVFATVSKIPLKCRDSSKIKSLSDIVGNHDFRIKLALKQGQARIMKAIPIYHDWSFETTIEFDDKIIDPAALSRVIQHAAKYGGFGDFRPTFGRATAECSNV